MPLTTWLIIIGAIIVFLVLIGLLLSAQYRKVGPNEALIIAGRKRTVTLPDGSKMKVGYRYKLGGGTFVWPFIEKVYTLPLEIISLQIKTPEVLTHEGIPIMAEASAQVKVDSNDMAIRQAAEQFLGTGKEGIRDVAMNVLEGKMREVIGTMTVEEIYRGRQEFSRRVVDITREDLAKMGLVLLSFSLKDISDAQGYIDALSKPVIVAAKRDAAIAQAETEKEATIKSSQARKEAEVARLQSEAQIAKAQWENEAKKAESQVFVNQKKAQADFSYELERFRVTQEIKKEEARVKEIEKEEAIKLEELEIKRKEKELEANVLKPADARKYQIQAEAEAEEARLVAEGRGKAEAQRLEAQVKAEEIKLRGLSEAEAMLKKAQAWEKYNEAALLESFIKVLPELAKAVAEPLSKVEKIVLVGGDKGTGARQITGQITEIIAQMPEVLKALTGADLSEYLKSKFSSKAEAKEKTKSESGQTQGPTPEKK